MEVYNLIINGEICEFDGCVNAKYVHEQIELAKSKEAKSILLVINSGGGGVHEGFAIYNLIKDSGIPTTTYIHGFCASIATLIATAGSKIEMSKNAQFMIHRSSGGGSGNAKDLESVAKALKQIDGILIDNYVARTGMTAEEVEALMEDSTYMTSEQALEFGFIDSIREPIAAFGNFKTQRNNIIMNKAEKKSLATAFAKLEKFLTGAEPKNFVEPLADGATILYGDGDLEAGKEVFIDEAMTEKANEGEHALASGKIVVVDAAGVIVEIREIEANGDEDANAQALADAQAKIADLEAQVASLTAEAAQAKTELETFKTTAKAEVSKLKAMVTSAGVEMKPQPDTKVSAFDAVAKEIKNKVRV